MTYEQLPQTLQDLVMVNTEMFLKIFFLSVLFLSCFFYVKTFKPKKNTPYLGVKVLRGVLYYGAYTFMFMMPLMAFLLYPTVSIEIVMQIVLVIYTLLIFIIGLIVAINIPFYGANFLFEMMGIENDFNNMNKDFKRVFSSKGSHDRLKNYKNTGGGNK